MTQIDLVPDLVPEQGRGRRVNRRPRPHEGPPPVGRGPEGRRQSTSSPSPVPTWLLQHLKDTGLMDEAGVTRRARPRPCRRCRTTILTGLDHDRVAATATADPAAISTLGEALAVLTGRPTYDLTWTGRYELDHRNQWTIAAHPPTSSRYVVAEHRCHAPPLPGLDATDPRPSRAGSSDEPTF